MAGKRKSKKSAAKRAKASAGHKTPLGSKSYAGKTYNCYGKRVKTRKPGVKSPRIYCAKQKPAGKK